MAPVFLIGGGWRADTFPETYGRFLQASTRGQVRRIAIIVAREDVEFDTRSHFLRFSSALETAGLHPADAVEIVVAKDDPLTLETIAGSEATGVLVCGGLTPAYHDGLCVQTEWLHYLNDNEIPYCGFSAGAAIAADNAILGGWLRDIGGRTVQIADENAGEDLEQLTVRPSLGLVDFSVEVHATQWGTLSRLIHAVDADLTETGWAIDENTMLEVNGLAATAYGLGNAYRVTRNADGVAVAIINSPS